uniref:conjugal transfer protein TraP n=1 Tax=Serratia TaxID=613 RepID=UPI001F4BFC50|nr:MULTISPECIES: conjugal transfer protein TraP [Serratia]ULG12051.1 hypothetical protein D1p1_00018 [Serratia entomophila]ULG12430.1 hypothetical protein M3p_00139 [Serratia entomophila]ULG15899.1 hypothetical protein 591p_00047 [Serratia proteamaculans]ULG18378.1 hypothetical protein Man4p_00060 [Serratia proteamaculans]
MISKILSVAMNGLSWLAWVFQWMVIWPAATLVLLLVLLFCLDGTTPGRELVGVLQQADSITDGQKWTWRKCAMTMVEERAGFSNVPVPATQENCPVVVTDADEFAAYIDRSLRGVFTGIWALMALLFGGISCLLRRRPYHHSYLPTDRDKREQ